MIDTKPQMTTRVKLYEHEWIPNYWNVNISSPSVITLAYKAVCPKTISFRRRCLRLLLNLRFRKAFQYTMLFAPYQKLKSSSKSLSHNWQTSSILFTKLYAHYRTSNYNYWHLLIAQNNRLGLPVWVTHSIQRNNYDKSQPNNARIVPMFISISPKDPFHIDQTSACN